MSALPLTLGIDIWENIAYDVLTGKDAFFGPPSRLCDLCLISRHVYDAIRFDNNSRLYARLFRFQFDYTALSRRLSPRWRNTRCLAMEYKKRMKTLKRVRRRQEFNVEDLWTCYLMMLENDGRNERHLVEWAYLYQYLHKFTIVRFEASRKDPTSWFNDDEATALTLWLWWMIFWPEALSRESPSTRDALSGSLLPEFIYAGYQYPSIYAPDGHFDLPLLPEVDCPVSCSGPPPKAKQVTHYGNALTLATPLLTPVALLVWVVRLQLYCDAEPFDPNSIKLPPDRQTANALGLRGPTVEDVIEFRGLRIRSSDRCPLVLEDGDNSSFDGEEDDSDDDFDSGPVLQGSRGYDDDWYRLVCCHDPWTDNPPLRGPVYRLGALTGSWKGRFVQTNFDVHMNVLRNPQVYHKKPAPLYSHPLFWELREHHCLHPNDKLPPGLDDFGGEDLLNAWLPQRCEVKHLENAVELYDPTSRFTTRYETFYPHGPASSPYSSEVCEKLRNSGILDQWEVAEEDDSNEGTQTQIEEEEYVDVVTHRHSGVRDILVTGATGERHGAAWGYFDIIGRVRPWDGLVVLLRTPRSPEQAPLGKWIFRGYIHNQNFVGRWRETSTSADLVGYEGGFVVCKTI